MRGTFCVLFWKVLTQIGIDKKQFTKLYTYYLRGLVLYTALYIIYRTYYIYYIHVHI